jgi:hypothetical protein
VFNEVLADQCPRHRPGIVHTVRLKDVETPKWGQLYLTSSAELVILKEWLEQNLSQGFVCESSSPFAAPDSIAKKPHGGLQFCIDYRDMNSKTIKNKYPHQLIEENLNMQGNAPIYSKLNVRGAYKLLRFK